jgi:predicted nucleic acid-binding protein
MEPILIDTNVLVYIYDRRDKKRQDRAIDVVGLLAKTNMGRLSAQCLSEFYNAATRQRSGQPLILTTNEAVVETEKLARAFSVYPVTQQVVLEALRGVQQYQFSLWDAQIWACARLNQIPAILSQDFQAGKSIEGVRFIDPFEAAFQLDQLI